MALPKLFLDCDGVLADFDTGARDALGGMTPSQFEARYSRREFWRQLAATPGFYANLPLMPDAQTLFEAVAHWDRRSSPGSRSGLGRRRKRSPGQSATFRERRSSPAWHAIK